MKKIILTSFFAALLTTSVYAQTDRITDQRRINDVDLNQADRVIDRQHSNNQQGDNQNHGHKKRKIYKKLHDLGYTDKQIKRITNAYQGNPEGLREFIKNNADNPRRGNKLKNYLKEHPHVKQRIKDYANEHGISNREAAHRLRDQRKERKIKKAKRFHEEYPDVTGEQIRKAVNHPQKVRRANELREQHPNASKKQIRRAANHPKAKAVQRRNNSHR